MDAGQAIVEIMKAEGVSTVFGLPGGHVLKVYDGIYKTPGIEHVLVRHEQHAASMAAAYAQLTGEPGICLVTAGPGATNLLTGITEAWVGCWPIIAICGRSGTLVAHKGANQEVDTHLVFRPVAKWTARIDRAEAVVDMVRRAFVVARSGRPGPVVLDIPPDVLGGEVNFDPATYIPVGKPDRPRADPQSITHAAQALAGARKPLIVAGGGAVMSGASEALVALAERLGAPVITTLSGRGSIPDSHPLCAGGLGGHRNDLSKQLLADADVVLSIGSRWEQMECNWRPGFVPSPGATFIQSDIYAEELGRAIVPNITVIGDARLVLEDLAAALGKQAPTVDRASVEAQMRRVLDNLEDSLDENDPGTEGQIHPIHVIRAVDRVFPADKITGFDVGFIAQQMAGAFPLARTAGPRSVISPSSFYGMGFVAAGLPAAKVVYPGRAAVCYVGDGSFQLIMNVMPTAVEHKLPVTWIVLNDMGLGSIYDIQKHNFGDRILATEFSFAPDFAAVARACGCYGEQVTDPAETEAAVRRALEANAAGQPAVLDMMIARERTVAAREFFPLEGEASGWSPKPLS
ncbi:thiamine pyrophosphate-binding protein [Blastomonas fulva]|uniref:thiamine pyrophosphate-binding protein n=1 Tax=Blastomonas fulva TaxID=1550728 RepID=UPI003F70DB8D